jgi:hypothetical protein
MPFHIEEVKSEVTVLDGDLPLTPAQMEKLIDVVMKRIEDKGRNAAIAHDAASIQRHVAPPLRIGD